MKIAIIGGGYVGLTVATCLAYIEHEVFCIESNVEKLQLLRQGKSPIYEPKLDEMISNCVRGKKIKFVESLQEIKQKVDCFFIAVGTPSSKDGSANLKYIYSAIKGLLDYVNQDFILIMKSTVPVGSAKEINKIINTYLENRGIKFEYISNPEFLREGAAVSDFLYPDRIVIGAASSSAFKFVKKLYRNITNNKEKYIFVSPEDAELIKYTTNAFLATKISFINEISRIAEHFGANILSVAKGIGSDNRISEKFLQAGCGYGGSCFPKDIDELIMLGVKNDIHLPILSAVKQVNQEQKLKPFNILKKIFLNNLEGKTIAIWGASFKPNTNDIRESPSLIFIKQAVKSKCKVKLCDPIAIPDIESWLFKEDLREDVFCYKDPYEAIKDVDALVLLTAWEQFKYPDWSVVAKLLKRKLVIDARNQYVNEKLLFKYGFQYYGIGVAAQT